MARINLPTATRSLLILLVGLTLLNVLTFPSDKFSLFLWTGRVSPLLGIDPRTSFRYPWTIVTATFVERNILGLIITSLSLFFGGRYLERAWGLNEFLKFIAVICAIPNAFAFTLYLLLPYVVSYYHCLHELILPAIRIFPVELPYKPVSSSHSSNSSLNTLSLSLRAL
jgi:membrane associated rhomboid family serine protease